MTRCRQDTGTRAAPLQVPAEAFASVGLDMPVGKVLEAGMRPSRGEGHLDRSCHLCLRDTFRVRLKKTERDLGTQVLGFLYSHL